MQIAAVSSHSGCHILHLLMKLSEIPLLELRLFFVHARAYEDDQTVYATKGNGNWKIILVLRIQFETHIHLSVLYRIR